MTLSAWLMASDLEAKSQLYQVGVYFEALLMGVNTAASNSGCILLIILTSGDPSQYRLSADQGR